MASLNPTDPLTATLEAQQWNQVLAILAESPYRVVASIITALHGQLNEPQHRSDNVVSLGEAID